MTHIYFNIRALIVSAITMLGVFALFVFPVDIAHAVDYYDSGCCGGEWDYSGFTTVSSESPVWDYSGFSSVPTYDWDYSGFTAVPPESPVWDYSGYNSVSPTDTDYYTVSTTYYDTYDSYTPTYSYYNTYDYYTPSYGYGYTGSYSYPSYVGSGGVVQGGYTTSPGVIYTGPYTYDGGGYVTGGGYTTGYTYPYYYNSPSYAAPTCYLSVSQNYISQGGSATLSWSSNNASSGYISGIGTVNPNGSMVVSPGATTQYSATFTGYGGSVNCYATVVVSGVYQQTPYVTLSQVPYTGLDLGPVGTALYWVFLVLACAVAAYLFAVKKIHTGPLNRMRTAFFGDLSAPSHPVYASEKQRAQHLPQERPSSPAVIAEDPSLPYSGAKVLVLPTEQAEKTEKTDEHTDSVDEFVRVQVHRMRS